MLSKLDKEFISKGVKLVKEIKGDKTVTAVLEYLACFIRKKEPKTTLLVNGYYSFQDSALAAVKEALTLRRGYDRK